MCANTTAGSPINNIPATPKKPQGKHQVLGLALGLTETSHLCMEGSLSCERRGLAGITSDRDPACLVQAETVAKAASLTKDRRGWPRADPGTWRWCDLALSVGLTPLRPHRVRTPCLPPSAPSTESAQEDRLNRVRSHLRPQPTVPHLFAGVGSKLSEGWVTPTPRCPRCLAGEPGRRPGLQDYVLGCAASHEK